MPGAACDINTGWAYLLPRLTGEQRLLYVEPRTTVPDVSGCHWPCSVTLWQPREAGSLQLPFQIGEFDAVVCRLIAGELATHRSMMLLNECARVLSAGGWLYVDIGACSWIDRMLLRRRISRWLRQQGFRDVRKWALLVERGALAEILPANGYRSYRNAWRIIERFKEWIYGPLATWCAPAHAFVAGRGELGTSMLGQLDRRVDAGDFVRMFVNPAKSFFQPGEKLAQQLR
jgi:hypothetical protein